MTCKAIQVMVGIADMVVTDRAEEVLVAHALGSCLGISVYDPIAGVCGLAHCMLPWSTMDREGAKTAPGKYVDTGVAALFMSACDLGAQKEHLILKAAGGACIPDHHGQFKIGERNCAALRKVLWRNGIPLESEDVGGEASRTMYVEAATGWVTIKSGGQEAYL